MENLLPENLEFLRNTAKLTQAEAATGLGLPRTTYVNYEKGNTNPDPLQLMAFADHFQVTVDDLLRNKLSDGKGIGTEVVTGNREKGKLIGKGNGKAKQDLGQLSVTNTGSLMPTVITVDSHGRENILYVPVKAKLGYAAGYNEPGFLQKLDAYRLPGVRNGTFRMFETEGASMAPTIHSGDRVVGQFVEAVSDIRDRRIYVVVTKDGYVVKRLLNRVSQRGKVVCLSDTVANRLEFPSYEIDFEQITQLWEAKIKLSANFAEPSEIFNRVNSLESDLLEMRLSFDDMRGDMAEMRQLFKGQLKHP